MKLAASGLGHHVVEPNGTRWLFRNLDLALGPGSLTSIVGPNGSGKTTLLRSLAGLLAPADGRATLDERPILRIPARRRARHLAYLPQTTPLVHDLTVHDLVLLGRAPHLPRFGGPATTDLAAVNRAVEQVGLSGLSHRRVFSLSGGEYQRVMLARMLASDARVLLLDEPTTSLDIGHALGVLGLVQQLARDNRVVMAALHDLELARRVSDGVICLHGDDMGTSTVGPTPNVLTAEVLGPVFGVRVESREDGLVFFPPR